MLSKCNVINDLTHYINNKKYYLATIRNISNIMTSKRLEGASTITQQVAKNFLLSNEISIDRKLKEAILAFRIERALSKERILNGKILLNVLFGRFLSILI